jgi:hypothetical protein
VARPHSSSLGLLALAKAMASSPCQGLGPWHSQRGVPYLCRAPLGAKPDRKTKMAHGADSRPWAFFMEVRRSWKEMSYRD